jgi:glycosyltransferase involved in cell wall biosynthesis
MPNSPRRLPVSLVIPAYNAEIDIRGAIESATAGVCIPSEIIVVDDASSDRTAEVAEQCGARVIRLARNAGPAAARNAGVAAAREAWVAFLDADDLWLGDKLEVQWNALQRWPDMGFCFTDYDVVGTAGLQHPREMASDSGYALAGASERHGDAVRFERGALMRGLSQSMFIRQSSVLIRRALVLGAGGYDEDLRLSEDYDFFLRLTGTTVAVAIERSLVTYQRRAASLSVDPVAEIASIDRLWGSILERPERYPREVVDAIAQRRPATLISGCRTALRLGRFAEAIPFARRAVACRRWSVAMLVLLGLSIALDNTPSRNCFFAARTVWRLRRRFSWPSLHSNHAPETAIQRLQVGPPKNPLFAHTDARLAAKIP